MAERKERTVNHKNLTRIDHPAKRTFGYFVRICWKGERRAKFFSDKQYGDRLGALDAALQWRNATEREMGKPRTEVQIVGFSSRNTSGAIGIRRRIKGGYNVYEVTWRSAEGRTQRTSISIDRYGEKEALRRAKAIRKEHEQERIASKPGRVV